MSSRSTRRSSRARKGSNEVVAPGFGTSADVENLQADLGGSLPVNAVTAMMRSEGRGVSGTSEASNPLTSPQTTNAWADFINEEGVGGSDALKKSEEPTEEPSTKRRKTDDEETPAAEENAEYDFSVLTTSNKKAPSGSLVQSGTLDATMIGRKALKSTDEAVYHLNIPTSLLPKVAITKVSTSCNAAHCIAIDRANQAYGWGRNENMVLGEAFGETKVVPTPQVIASDIQDAALGKTQTIFLKTDGTLHALGTSKSGQCGWRQNVKQSGTLKACVLLGGNKDLKFTRVACGEDFSVALDEEGILYTAGSSEFGQLANGETGEYFMAANKLGYSNGYGFAPQTIFHQAAKDSSRNDVMKKTTQIMQDIRFQAIACGKHFALALEAPNKSNPSTRVFSWGSGNYGCLGHGRQADEYYPRHVENCPTGMAGIKIAAGSTCSLLLTSNGHAYYWGQHQSSKDAVMKPKLVDALANNQHIVTHIGAGNSNVACSTDLGNTVVWGQGQYGELGLGSKKSSAKPAFVDQLAGVKILDLSCGQGSILYVVEDDKDLPKVDSDAVEKALNPS
jgi:alpha-tubulin suppressor-like RCC1 family protein